MSVIAYVKGPGRDVARERFAAAVALVEVRERRASTSDWSLESATVRYEAATKRFRDGLEDFLRKRFR